MSASTIVIVWLACIHADANKRTGPLLVARMQSHVWCGCARPCHPMASGSSMSLGRGLAHLPCVVALLGCPSTEHPAHASCCTCNDMPAAHHGSPALCQAHKVAPPGLSCLHWPAGVPPSPCLSFQINKKYCRGVGLHLIHHRNSRGCGILRDFSLSFLNRCHVRADNKKLKKTQKPFFSD